MAYYVCSGQPEVVIGPFDTVEEAYKFIAENDVDDGSVVIDTKFSMTPEEYVRNMDEWKREQEDHGEA